MELWRMKLKEAARKLKKNPKFAKYCLAVKSNGKLCKHREVGLGRCKFHGGMSLTGVNAPSYKHGKWIAARHKAEFLKRVEELKKDPNLTDLSKELAIMKTLLETTLMFRKQYLKQKTQQQIVNLIKDTAHLIDTMKKVNEGYTLTIKNAENVVAQVVQIINNRVKDQATRSQIAGDIRAMHLIKDT